MSKGLEALETIKQITLTTNTQEHSVEIYVNKYFDAIEKGLKAISIINKKEIDVHLLKRSENWLDYYTRFKHRTGKNTELIEEEYDLLKEVLNE